MSTFIGQLIGFAVIVFILMKWVVPLVRDMMHKQQDKPVQASAALKFFDWAYANGDQAAADLEYVALPESVKNLVRKQWAEVKDAGGKQVAFK